MNKMILSKRDLYTFIGIRYVYLKQNCIYSAWEGATIKYIRYYPDAVVLYGQ